MSVDAQNIKVLAGEAKVQRQTILENAESLRILQAQVAQLKTELNSLGQELTLLKYSRGIGRTA